MSDSITVDAARLPLLLGELRLPTVAKLWQTFTERADREGWPSARLLATLAEFELAGGATCSATSAGGAAAIGQDSRPKSPSPRRAPAAHVAQHRTDRRSVRHDFRRIVPKGAALELV